MGIIKQIIKYLIIAAVIVVALDVAAVLTLARWRPEIKHADAVIVLGAAINTPALYNRTLEGLHLVEQGKADTMVLSGGKISEADISEAQYMEKVIKKNAQKKVSYILEEESRNTLENIYNSKAKLGDKKSVIVVSDEFHLARAVLVAKRAGFEEVYWSSPKPEYYKGKELRFYYYREFIAMLSYIPKLITN
ncbi:MAG: YdcF family protein [bacterium]|nr:YdcF family protein [bacterium]